MYGEMCKNAHGSCTVATIQLYTTVYDKDTHDPSFLYSGLRWKVCPTNSIRFLHILYMKPWYCHVLQIFSHHSAINLNWNMKAELLSRFVEQVVYFRPLHTTFPRHIYLTALQINMKLLIVIRRHMSNWCLVEPT